MKLIDSANCQFWKFISQLLSLVIAIEKLPGNSMSRANGVCFQSKDSTIERWFTFNSDTLLTIKLVLVVEMVMNFHTAMVVMNNSKFSLFSLVVCIVKVSSS